MTHSEGGRCCRAAVFVHVGGCVRSLLSGLFSPSRSIPSPDMSANCSAPAVRFSHIRTASRTRYSRSGHVVRSDHHGPAGLRHSQLVWVPWRDGIEGARSTPAQSCRERPSFDRAGRGAGALLPARCDPVPEMFHVKQPVGVSRSIEDRRPPGAGVVEPGATSAAAAPVLREARRKEVQTREGLRLRASGRSVTPARTSSRPHVSRETIVAHTPLLGTRTRGRWSRAAPCLRATHDNGSEISRRPPNPAAQRCALHRLTR